MRFTTGNIYALVLMAGSLVFWASCSDMHDYKEYVEEGERVYTGKVDSLTVYSGENRVLIEGLFISDPKITETRIYWNSASDSIVVPVERTERTDTLRTYIEDLQEGSYNFEIVTLDEQGNRSIPVYANGQAFGQRYQASLSNRPIIDNELYAGDLTTTIRYGGMDLTSGVFATEVRYTDASDQQHTRTVSIDSEEIQLENFKVGTEFEYRTLFLPDTTSIDTFSTEFEAVAPEMIYLKNYRVPFEAESRSGRWGTLADWVTNDAIKIHNGHGGWDEWNNNIFNVESGWGAPGITNGKIYQTVTLAPGTYTFKANLRQVDGNNDTSNEGLGDYAYIAVAEGTTLPDVNDGAIENDPATIGYSRILQSKDPDAFEITFTISQQQEISVGYATTQPGGNVSDQYPGTSNGRHCNITSFEFSRH